MEYFIMLDDPSAVWLSHSLLGDKIDSNLMHAKFINNLDKNYINLDKKMNVITNGEIIEELTDFTANGSFESLNKNVEYTDERGIPFIRIKNMSENGLVMDDVKFITENTYEYLKKSKLEGNEVLFSKTGANLGLAMVVSKNIGKASLADNTFKVIYKEGYDKHYLVSFFNSKYGKLWVERLSQGSAQPTIIKESFRQIKIPIPSPEIQKYIGDKVRKAEELREEAKRLKKEAEEIFENYFYIKEKQCFSKSWVVPKEMLSSDRIDNSFYKPKYLKVIKSIGNFSCSKKMMCELDVEFNSGAPASSNDFTDRGIPLVRIRDIGKETLNSNIDTYVPDDIAQSFNYAISRNGDIVVGMDGDEFKANIVTQYDSNYLINQRITIIRSKQINPYYLYFYINSYIGQQQLQKNSVKTTVGHISMNDIKNLIVCIPEHEIYEQLVEKVEKYINNLYLCEFLIKESKQDVEDLIEGNFDMSKIKETN